MSRVTQWKGHKWLALAFRLYLGAVFLVACFHKILHPEVFALDVATYQFLPLWSVNFFALVVPWLELAAGLMLVFGVKVRAASLLTAAMMVSFMVGLSFALHQGLDMSCGCFASQAASGDDPISWHTLVRDSVWLFQSLYIFAFDLHPIGLEGLFRKWRKNRD